MQKIISYFTVYKIHQDNNMIFNSSIITIITSTTGKTPDGEMLVV
ncbi:hypothetical protein [Pedobacter sp. ASV12]|nr:hypothetical protein [Pedobacter sp. ASV12]